MAAVEALRHEIVPGGAGLKVRDSLYVAEFGTAGFSLSHSDSSRAFGLRTVTVDDAPVREAEWRADGNTAERLVSPGVVERVTAKDGHVEWDFVLAGAPAGDLRIDAVVDARGPPRREQGALQWPAGRDRTVRMGELVVVDASGRELYRALPDVHGERITLNVPHERLAGASYPVTVDPVIGLQHAASTATPGSRADDDQFTPSVAFDGTNYLVVWTDDRDNLTVDIYGARVAPNGTFPDGGGFAISTSVGSHELPTVAYGGSTFYVTWTGTKYDPEAESYETGVYGTPVSTSGAVLHPEGVLLSSAPDTQIDSVVGYDGANFLVAWTDERSGGHDIYGTRVSPAGAVLDPSGIAISAGAQDQINPAIVSAGSNAFVAWSDERSSEFEIWGTPVGQDGVLANPTGLRLSPAGENAGDADLAFDGTNFLLTWTTSVSFVTDIHGARITPTGVVLDAAGFVISSAASDQRDAEVAFDGTNFLVAWEDERGLGLDIYGARVSTTGVLLDPSGLPLAVTTEDEMEPIVGASTGEFFVGWTGHLEFDGNRDIHGVRVAGAGTLNGSSFIVSRAAAEQIEVDVAFDGTNYLVVWEQGTPFDVDIYAARVAPDGTKLDGPGFVVSGAPLWQASPSVAFNGTNYLVAWEDQRAGTGENTWDIYGSRVSPSGTVLDPAGVAISTATKNQATPSVAFDGTNFVVAWADERGSSWDIYQTRVNSAGTVLSATGVALSTASGAEFNPEITRGATNMLVAWENDGTSNISARLMNLTGGVVGSTITVSSAVDDQERPTVAFDGSGYLVAWHDYRSSQGPDIYAARVNGSGALVDSATTGIAIATGLADELRPSAAYVAPNFVVAWRDGYPGNISAARVSTAGVVMDKASFPVTSSVTSEIDPAVIGLPNGTAAFAYSRRATELPWGGANQASLQVVTDLSSAGAEPIVDSGPPPVTGATPAVLAFHHPDGAPMECSLDYAAFAPCVSPQTYTDLEQGHHTFRIRVNNGDGTFTTGTGRAWRVDLEASPPNIDTGPNELVNSKTAQFTFSTFEPDVTFECKLDSGSYETCTSPKTYTNVPDGFHTFYVRTIDPVGNISEPDTDTWVVDTTPPNPPVLTSKPNALSSQDFAFFEIDVGPGASLLAQCRLDAAAFSNCWTDQQVNYDNLADGQHTFQVRSRDEVGNFSNPTSYTWTVDDTDPPAPTINSGPDGPTNNKSPTFAFSDTEALVIFLCFNGSFTQECDSPKTYPNLTDGTRTFTVRAVDLAGNISAAASRTYTIDTVVPPTPTITSGPTGVVESNSASFTFADTEAGVSYDCKLDAAEFAACSQSPTFVSLSGGPHTLQVRARDAAGNPSAPTAAWSWTVEDGLPPPTPTFGQAPSGTVASTSASIAFSDSEAGVVFECSLDGPDFAVCTSPKTYSGLAQGAHTFQVRAKDSIGNTSEAATRSWSIDTVGPVAPTIDSGPSGAVASTSASFTFSDAEAGAVFECKLDAAAFAVCTSPLNLSSLGQGAHTFEVRAKDALGNLSTSAIRSWTVDTIAPVAPLINGGPSGLVGSSDANFAFSHSEGAGVTFECKLDLASFTACSSPANYAGLADGAHVFQVRATDSVGNAGAISTRNWTVDTVAPVLPTITSGPAGSVASTGATFAFSHTQGGVTLECKLDLGAFAACASPRSYTGLAQGAHSFQVRAVDGAGNASLEAARAWKVDTVAPSTAIGTKPKAKTTARTAKFTFKSEKGAKFECKLDKAGFKACKSPGDVQEPEAGQAHASGAG